MSNKTKRQVITSAIVFTVVFNLLRAVLEQNTDTSHQTNIALAILVASITGGLIGFLYAAEKRTVSLILFLILTGALFSSLVVTNSSKRIDFIDLRESAWSTRDSIEAPIEFHFLDDDRVDFVIGKDGKRRFYFEVEEDVLTIFDEEGDVSFEWNVFRRGDSLTLTNTKDVLNFYRIK